jgi:hypothetical protein
LARVQGQRCETPQHLGFEKRTVRAHGLAETSGPKIR